MVGLEKFFLLDFEVICMETEDSTGDEDMLDGEFGASGFKSILLAQKKIVSVSIGAIVFTLLSVLGGVVTYLLTSSVAVALLVCLTGLVVVSVMVWILVWSIFQEVISGFLNQ